MSLKVYFDTKETKTAEGKQIYIPDGSDETILSAKLDGETSQATRSGKNILINNAVSTETGGVTFTKNDDGSITINGTNTSGSTITYNIVTRGSGLFKLNAGEYILSGCTGGSTATYYLYIADGTNVYYNITTPVTFTVSNDNTTCGAFISIGRNKTVNTTIYPQLEVRKSSNKL